MLNLVQTLKMPKLPIICFDRSYWTRVVNFDALVEEGMVAAESLKLFSFADEAEETWASLIASGLRLPEVGARQQPAKR
jgi:predicted Rossmann-fold nucleotide-binding protein